MADLYISEEAADEPTNYFGCHSHPDIHQADYAYSP